MMNMTLGNMLKLLARDDPGDECVWGTGGHERDQTAQYCADSG